MADVTEDPTVDEKTGEPLSDAELIARRSADIHTEKAKKGEHVKVFTLPPGPKPTPENGYDHEANKAATRQYAISQGMRPTGDVRHVSTAQHPNGVSWNLTYAVPVAIAERIEEPSEPDIVTGGSDVAVNTSGAGHSSNTDPNLEAAHAASTKSAAAK